MALVNSAFTVNVTPGAMPPVVHVSEYDIGRTYTVTINGQNGSAFNIPTGTTATVEGTLNGSVGFTQSATISNNQVSFALSESMTAYSGKAWCKIKLSLNDEPIQTCAFVLDVDRAGVEAETVIGAPGFEEQIANAVDAYMDEHPVSVEADSALSDASENPVQNKVITAAVSEINNRFELSGGSDGSSNLLNPEEVVEGYYITNTNDRPATNAGYWYSGYIPVEVGKTYSFQRGNLTVTSGRQTEYFKWLAAYDAEKNLLSAKGSTAAKQYTVPDGVAYVRICANITFSPVSHYTTFVEGTTVLDYEPYEEPSEGVAVLKAENNNAPYINGLIDAKFEAKNNIPFGFSHSFNLASGATYSIEHSMQDKLGYCMAFRGDIAADFQGVIMAHGYQIANGGYVKVTPTVVEYYLGTEAAPRISVEHGLTLTDYVAIVLNANAVNKMDLTVYTNGGSFSRTGLAWDVCRGHLRAQSVGTTTMQNCKLSYWCKDWAASTHLFGDSYFSMYADRWTYYLRNAGFTDNLINGYGGRTAQDALPVAKTVLEHSQPKRIVWCLGMNNADSGAVNANWKTAVEELAAICDSRNIELILATIPNVPTVDNTYKNAYVRASGRRYIDFAAAVGASNDTTWYTGMLSSDNTHPTTQGAIALYTQAIADVPELAT